MFTFIMYVLLPILAYAFVYFLVKAIALTQKETDMDLKHNMPILKAIAISALSFYLMMYIIIDRRCR